MKVYKKLSVHFIFIRQTQACLGQALLCFLPEFFSHISWKVMLECDSNYIVFFLWNNQRHKVVQWSKEYYLKSYKSSHYCTSAAMLHAFTLAYSSFCTAKFISTIRWGGKSHRSWRGRIQTAVIFKLHGWVITNVQQLWKDSAWPRPQWKWINQN